MNQIEGHQNEAASVRNIQVVTTYAHRTSKSELQDIHEMMSEYERIYNGLATKGSNERFLVIAVKNNRPVMIKTSLH